MYKLTFSKTTAAFLVILFLSFFLRFYGLTHNPVQLNHDEISQLYDTGSIIATSKDIYGNKLPLAFPSTGDYKPGHYIYITTIPYLIFGNKEFVIRFAAAFFGSLLPLVIFILLYSTTKKLLLSFLAALFVTINPADIFYARKSFENVIGVFLLFSGLTLLINFIGKKLKLFVGIGGLLLISSSMYVYTSETIIAPVILFLSILIYKKEIFQAKKRWLVLLLLFVLTLIPLLYLNQIDSNLKFRASSVFITQDRLLGERLSGVQTGNFFLSEISKKIITFEFIVDRYLQQFNPLFIFGNGLNLTNQGFIGVGPLLAVELPFFIAGLIFVLRNAKSYRVYLLICLSFMIGFIPTALTFEEKSPHRVIFSFTSAAIISSLGVYWFIECVKRFNKITKRAIYATIIAFFVANFVYFIQIYTVNWPYEKSQHLHYPFKQIALFAWYNYSQFDQIIIDPVYGDVAPVQAVAVHYYLAYYGNYSPDRFQKDLKLNEWGMSVDKFAIRTVYWPKDQKLQNTLIIASPWSLPIKDLPKEKILKTFNFYNGKPAYYAIKL